jgi:tetratricopeptide (TPR) repeat protein
MGSPFDEKLKDTEPTACFSGRIVEEMTLEPPEGRQFTKLPADVRLRTGNLEFTAQWSASRSAITVRREFISRIDKPLCEGDVRRETAKMLGGIRRHYQFDLVSLTNPVPAGGNVVTDALALMKRGEEAWKGGDWDSAIRFYSAAILALNTQADPNSLATAYNGRGLAYAGSKDLIKAIADYTQAIRIVPNYYAAFVNRGNTYAAQHRWERAEGDFAQAIRINDKDEGMYRFRAMSSFDRGLFRRALDDCDISIRLAPATNYCYAVRARVRYVRSEFELAIADGTEAIRLFPADPTSLYNRGLAYLASAQYRKAIADFDASNKITPNLATVLFARGVAKMKAGDDTGSETDIAAAKKLDPNIALRMAGFGVSTSVFVPGVDDLAACKTAGRNDVIQGVVYCTRTLIAPSLGPQDKAVTYANLGEAYFRLGEYDEAIVNLDNALHLTPDNAVALAERAVSYSKKGNQDQAREDLSAAVKLAPGDPLILMFRAGFYASNGEMDLALVDWSEVIRQQPGYVVGYFERAKLYEKTDQLDKAISDLNAAVRIQPVASSYGARCLVLAYADRLTAAMADCERALAEVPNNSTALSSRGFIYLKLGEDSKATEDFNHAIDRDPDVMSLAYYGRGLLKLKSGDKSGDDDIAEASLLDADLVVRMRRRGLKP